MPTRCLPTALSPRLRALLLGCLVGCVSTSPRTPTVASDHQDAEPDRATISVPGLHALLVATSETTPQEDAALRAAVEVFRANGRENVDDPHAPFVRFLEAFPGSAWAVAVRANLGYAYYQAGRFSNALEQYRAAWQQGRDVSEPGAKGIVDWSVGELARMHARLGHQAELERLFGELGDRPVTGPATEAITGAREGAWEMQHDPGAAFLCGPKALVNTLRVLNGSSDSIAVADAARSAPGGYTLSQLSQLADEVGLAHQLIHRTAGHDIPVPAIINWKLHHYAAIVGERDGAFYIKDPTFGDDLVISRAVLEAETQWLLFGSGRCSVR